MSVEPVTGSHKAARAAGAIDLAGPGAPPATDVPETWRDTHDRYLETLVEAVRIRMRRRVLWLRRHHWRSDPLDELRADLVTDERADRLTAPPAGDEAAFWRDDPEAAELTRALRDTETRLGELDAGLAGLGDLPRLRRLREAADLGDIERDAVISALAVELEPSLAPLFGYVEDEPALAAPTPRAVAALFGHPSSAAWALLDGERPLRRLGLLHSGALPSPSLTLDPRTLAYLLGGDALDPAVRDLTRHLEPLPVAAGHRVVVDRVTLWLRARPAGEPALVNLVGDSDHRAIVVGVAAETGRCALDLDPAKIAAAPDPARVRTALEREAVLGPALFHIDVGDAGDTARDTVIAQISALDALIIVSSRTRTRTRRDLLVERVGELSAADRAALWRQAGAASDADAATLAAQFHLDPSAVASAAADARARAELDGSGGAAPGAGRLWAAARELVGRDLGAMAQRIAPVRTLDDLVLPAPERAILTDLVAQNPHRTTVYRDWGYERLLPRGQGVTVLFTGPPGTGKTMAAEALAGALDLDLYRIDLSAVVSKYIGETEKNLRRVFDAAETGAAVLFFDEADALFGKRTEIRDSHDRHANVEVNYLLQRMEDYQGLAILATNRKGDLDPAFLRRIRTVVSFAFPDLAHRRRIWETVLPDQTPTENLDLDALARLEVAGGSIRNIALAGAFLAAAGGEPLRMDHLMVAARREYAKIDKVVTAAEFGPWAREQS